MNNSIKMVSFPMDGKPGSREAQFSYEKAMEVRNYHKTIREYAPTPLHCLNALAKETGVKDIYIKDESYRFSLNAFKGLGGSYASAKVLAEKSGNAIGDMTNIEPGTYTFVTATDGNHGRGVAWAAQRLGQKAVVYMPKGSALERLNNIRALGAEALITEWNYDDTVRYAKKQAESNGWILIQDTSWEGYEEIPLWIMQGYMTMALEVAEQLNGTKPTHIFLQAGVGSMAGAVTGFFANYYKEEMPNIIIVEPLSAACLFETAKANDALLHFAKGSMDSIMAGLCCGEVCSLGWDILKHHAEYYFSCPDYVAADGMRVLANPVGNDPRIISGESGASTSGLLYHLLKDADMHAYKEKIGLNKDSVVLCFSTEGATDQTNYRRIVWDGWYAK